MTGSEDALGKPKGSDERHGKQTYVSEFGIDRARQLAAESHATARGALGEIASVSTQEGSPDATAELENITDFIFTRTS